MMGCLFLIFIVGSIGIGSTRGLYIGLNVFSGFFFLRLNIDFIDRAGSIGGDGVGVFLRVNTDFIDRAGRIGGGVEGVFLRVKTDFIDRGGRIGGGVEGVVGSFLFLRLNMGFLERAGGSGGGVGVFGRVYSFSSASIF